MTEDAGEPSPATPADLRFGEWTLRRRPRELYRGGVRVPLQDQPLQLLEELLIRAGDVVTREQLIARLWPRRVVDFDTALNAAVRRLRIALGDAADTPRYIETLPRVGYRYVGPPALAAAPSPASRREPAPEPSNPEVVPDARGTRPSRTRWRAAAGVAMLAAAIAVAWLAWRPPAGVPPDQPAIAVLPFADLSPEQDQRYFSDGLTEEILNLLAQAPGLRVTARTSSFVFRDGHDDIATVAEKLDVTHVLEGSVRRSGDRIRVTAQLIDGRTSLHLWSRTYDGSLDDVFTLQADIAGQVASALRVTLAGPPRTAGTPGDPAAYEHYLRAKFAFQRRAPGDLDRAERHFRAALDLEPGYARAWAGLAGVHWIQVTDGTVPAAAGLERQRDAAERALALDPANVEGHVRLAAYLRVTGDRARAREHWNRALALEPENPLLLGLRVQGAAEAGRWDEALRLQRRAADLDPMSVIARHNLSYFLLLAGRYEEAATESLRAAEIDPAQLPESYADTLILQQRYDEALRLVDRWPAGQVRSRYLALIHAGAGHDAESRAALAEVLAKCDGRPGCQSDLAEIHAQRGEFDAAFARLDTIARVPAELRPSMLRFSPYLRPLHGDPRWPAWDAVMNPPEPAEAEASLRSPPGG